MGAAALIHIHTKILGGSAAYLTGHRKSHNTLVNTKCAFIKTMFPIAVP